MCFATTNPSQTTPKPLRYGSQQVVSLQMIVTLGMEVQEVVSISQYTPSSGTPYNMLSHCHASLLCVYFAKDFALLVTIYCVCRQPLLVQTFLPTLINLRRCWMRWCKCWLAEV